MKQSRPARVELIGDEDLYEVIKHSLGTTIAEEIDPHFEAAKASADIQKRGGKYNLSDVRKWLEGPIKVSGARRGPKQSHDWDAAWAFMCGVIFKQGLPDRQNKMVKIMQEWFSSKYDKEPAKSEIEKRVSLLYKEVSP